MGRSRFPGKPLKFQNRKRISVLSGTIYHETTDAHSNTDGAPANVFTEDKEEEEKKETNNDIPEDTIEKKLNTDTSQNNPPEPPDCNTSDPSNSPVRTRSQNKMDTVKSEKPKPVKKTVTFGTVESCDDTFLPLKKLPSKNLAPLVSIIKKKSALKHTEYSTFSSILKPPKLIDLNSKSSSEHHEGYIKKNLNPLSKTINKFSQFSESRCISPPPRSSSPDRESGIMAKFVLPIRSAHSSRVIKPNKKFMDIEDNMNLLTGSSMPNKVLKKPKLKQLVFNSLTGDDDIVEEAESETSNSDSIREKPLIATSNLFKDKTMMNCFATNNSNSRNIRDFFTYDKEEYSQDENFNHEGLEKAKIAESHKDDRGGHALRKLVDISDVSSASSSSSESESEESWDSDSPGASGDDKDSPALPSPERDKAPASQLLRGKVIIREARLQLNPPSQSTLGPEGPFSTFTGTNSPNPPEMVTCGVCGAVRFYRFVRQARKFGIYSCESCRKFISKMLKKIKGTQAGGPAIMQCLKGEGNCHVPSIVRSQQWKLLKSENKARCPACWLKMCLKAFQVPPNIRTGLTAMLPVYMRTNAKPSVPQLTPVNPLRIGVTNAVTVQTGYGTLTNNDTENKAVPSKCSKNVTEDVDDKSEDKSKKELLQIDSTTEGASLNRKRTLSRVKVRKKDKEDESKQIEDPKRQKVELKGPRVKHVCRSASIVLGQPIATFPTQEEKDKAVAISHDTDHPMPIVDKPKHVPEAIVDKHDSDVDMENKPPQVVPEVTVTNDEVETAVEAKKRKVDIAIPSKPTCKAESSEDENAFDLVPRKAIMKPLTNITNVRGRVQKCDQNRPEVICVDFWESYDPDEVCTSGFGLIGTTTFTVPRLCFLCGSAGHGKMLVCTSCCEWYHSWCAEEPVRSDAGWVCGRCVSCAACGRAAARLRCRSCAGHYHAACLPTPPPDHRSDWPQICSTCLKCKSCDSDRVSKFVGSLPFCSSCFKLRQKGNYCPLCQACYRDNDFDSKMMECGWCSRWVHASCEGLSGEGYQLLSALPPSVEYICRQCMPHDPPWRKMLTEHLKGRLLHLLKLLAKNKKACALLKLTPHKNTPVLDKPYRIMSPLAIRKLHFDSSEYTLKNITETKVYRNTAKGRRSNQIAQKSDLTSIDNAATDNIWHCPLLPDVMIKEEIPHPTHKVVNLQEPLMQNKEICFSTGIYGVKTEFDVPCVEVHENNPPEKETTQETSMSRTIHVDKYEAISDDDDPSHPELAIRSVQDLSPVIVRSTGISVSENRIISPSLLDIKRRVNCDEYMSLKDFNHDMREVIKRTLNGDLQSIYKGLFFETFPWFDCDNNCLQPNLEVEGEHDDSELVKDNDIKDNTCVSKQAHIERPFDQIVPKLECEGEKLEELFETYSSVDSRTCILCKSIGDGSPDMEGRLLYCGQNDWIHANCALWSAEVFEEIDGSLQNVHSAISRGKMIKCAICEMKGASVGCCAKNCGETYHYSCARKENCAFMDDKRVFCPIHGKDVPKKNLQKDTDFELTRPVYVELDKKKKRFSEINKVQFLLGSLTVQNIGKIVPSVSDYEDFLMPVDFMCTRLFWSSKKPSKVVRYTIKTKLILSEPLPGFDLGVNITVDHSKEIQIVDRVMAEIGAWHKTLEHSGNKSALLMKKDKSPIKYGSGVTLEDLAVKQVVEYILDNVCKQEQQDEEEPQNTADLLPPELKDAIFEDLNHDLLDGISMQDIFPKLMSYEDLAVMDLKNEFYGAISQSDDKNIDKSDRSATDFIDELLNARLESGSKELKRSKSEMLLQNHNLKSLTTGRGQQRSSSLTWNNKFDSSLLSSTIKRCKMGRTSTITGKLSPIQRTNLTDAPLETVKEVESSQEKKKEEAPSNVCNEAPHTSGISYHTTSPKEKESETNNDKSHKSEGYYTDVIDFYTKIQCSPISQLDGACDWSESDSSCSSRPSSPNDNTDFSPISQLDGADDHMLGDHCQRNQTNQFLYRASGTESTYTVTIAGTTLTGQPEFVMRPLDDGSIASGHMEQPVRCDRCQCTYRNKESYDRHVPSCDMMSTSESESENPKSPESRTLTTLQNAFQGAFAQPMIIHAGVVSGSDGTIKAEGISARRTSINTRQITINGTIVETPSPGPSNEMTMTITEQMKSGTVIFDHNKTSNMQGTANQQILSSPQIVVTPQMLMPTKTTAGGQKMLAPQILTQNQGLLPYNICVKSGPGNNIQQIQSGTDMTQILSGAGGIQVLSSNSNQLLTIPSNHQQILHGKNQVANFPNMASATSIAVPVNGMSNSSLIQNIQPMIRPHIQGNPTIVVPAMTTQRLSSPNSQHKQQIIMPGNPQKSPKKQPLVQPKPIFQATNRARGRPIPKPTTIKRQTKLEKTFTTINQSPLGSSNTVIQLQTNNQTGQPSILVQPVSNQNIMSAYVEALSQQQNQNMQYIATIAPQNDYKQGPTQFISQGSLMPQTFQIQQTESGGLVAVPSGGIPVLLPQGNVGILPQTLQQGATILPQGTIQTQGLLPQTIHTQNGTTIIPQGTIQSINQGNLSNNTLQTGGATMVPQNGIGNNQTTIIPNSALSSQGNTLISSGTGATILPQGTILPQFCNDQVILGSAPTLEMVTDQSGCMYLTTTPVYYGLETIVQNTVMSSQQFVSTAMQGVLAQNSSFSATTTQVFQASKIEPIVEVPTGYVVVNNVGDAVTSQTSTSNVVTGQTVHSSPQTMKTVKTSVPNITLQPLPDKQNINRQTPKIIHMSTGAMAMGSQSGTVNIMSGRSNIHPITSQIHTMSLSNAPQLSHRGNMQKPTNISISPNVTLVSSSGHPVMSISQSIPNSTSFSLQSIPLSHPIVSTSTASSLNKSAAQKMENSHIIEISGNLQENSNSTFVPTISVAQSLKSPTPWRQVTPSSCAASIDANKGIDVINTPMKGNNMNNTAVNMQNNSGNLKTNQIHHNDGDKLNHSCLMQISNNTQGHGMNIHSHQFESNINVSHHSNHQPSNVIQITSGNIYTPSSTMNTFDAETTMKLNKINTLSKTEGGHMNFSQEIMAPHSHQHNQNDKTFQNLPTNDNKQHMDGMNNQMNIHKLNSCQMAGQNNNGHLNIMSHNMMRSQVQASQNMGVGQNHHSQMIAMSNNSSHSMQMINSGNNSLSNMSCQEPTNRASCENNVQQNNQSNLAGDMPPNNQAQQNNIHILGHESNHHPTPNQIHIMNGQIQHNRSGESTQIQQPNMMSQGPPNRSFHDNMVGGQQHNQGNMLPNRSPENNALLNQSLIHNMQNNHNSNRQQMDISHVHVQQQMGGVNNMQNNRILMDNMQAHQMNNVNHQMHSNRSIDTMHNQLVMNHHMNNNRQQIDNNIHLNSQMGMQQSRLMDNVGHHHQHQASNIMQIQNNRSHVDNNIMNMHSHMPNQMHNRQLDNNMHMHHVSNNAPNQCMNNQVDHSNGMNPNVSPNMHNRHDNNTMPMQNMNVLNQIQNSRTSMEHSNLMQHQMNNINMHNNNNMQMNNSNQQGINNSMLHMPNIPDIKNEIQGSCSGTCSNSSQFTNNQTSFEMCSGHSLNGNNNVNANTGNMMHNININNTNVSNNMIMNNVNNGSMFCGNNMNNVQSHDLMMSCNNSSEHNVASMIPPSTNHMIMNNSQSHPNSQNQLLNNQSMNTQQMNMNNMNISNSAPNQLTNMDVQINRANMTLNEPAKFSPEPMRGKNLQLQSNQNMPSLHPHTTNDCAKVNILGNDKNNHGISVNNQMGYMQMNAQNNRVINLPERNRLNNTNVDTSINQHNIPQHNIRVVTNNNSNVGGINPDPLNFQQKTEANSTMINIPFQAIPNSAPMNINVNSSNNTVNITVQNNLVDPKIASKASTDITFPIQANANLVQNQTNTGNMICIPVQNNTINLPAQSTSSLTLPKAPASQQSGIPTNIVTPISMRPMNRVLPLHRDGQSKTPGKATTVPKTPPVAKQRSVSHDMPDLNSKEESVDSDLEKAIEESKRMMELETAKQEKEDMDAVRAMEISTEISENMNVTEIAAGKSNNVTLQQPTKLRSLPNLDAELEIDPPKVLVEKSINKVSVPPKLPLSHKIMKRTYGNDKKTDNPVMLKKQNKIMRGQENIKTSGGFLKQNPDPPKDDGPKLIYEVTSEDGFSYSSTSLTDLWLKVVESVQNARKQMGLKSIQCNLPSTLGGAHLFGLNNNALRYLVEQLPGANRCIKYKTRQGRPLSSWDHDLDLSEGFKESFWGSARTGPIGRKPNHDMFSWMASPFREEPPPIGSQEGESVISRRLATLPMAMRFRHLKETSKASVGVYRSHIHGRGLFCKREIEEGDMVIEYAGEVIRAVLADQREKRYEAMRGRRGVAGCYMFRIDDNLVVDATLKGNPARFINHSCDPNCYSRVVDIHGHKHILIFALRKISVGEELTYDYKFPFEEVKIPCTCGAKKCRKYLN